MTGRAAGRTGSAGRAVPDGPAQPAGDQPDSAAPPEIDVSKPHPARIYDYFLGGKDNFAADRQTARQVLQNWGAVRAAVRENRAFLGRAVHYLAAEAGIRQFLDIGTGLPSSDNVHEVAQAFDPRCRVVYVDNDPIVLTHARALLASDPRGACAYINADLLEPDKILGHPATTATLDFSQPVALMLVAVLHFIPDEDEPGRSVQALVDALAPGSYVVASHVTDEHNQQGLAGAGRAYSDRGLRGALRGPEEFAELAFPGLELIRPGVVLVSEWRPDTASLRPMASEINAYCGVARKP